MLTHSLRNLPLAVIDIESTGLGPESRIVEIAVVHLDLGSGTLPRVAMCQRVDPGIPMEPGASRVTGITDEDLEGCPTFREVAPLVHEALQGRFPVAYNAPADYGWLSRELDVDSSEVPWPWLDALVWAKVVDKYEPAKTQTKVAERRGIAVDAHGAAGDAVTTALLAEPLLREWAYNAFQSPSDQWPTLNDLLTCQRGTAIDQEADFCSYMLRTHGAGNKPRPDCRWHELEGVDPPYWPEPTPPVGRCLRCRGPATYKVDKDGTVQLYDTEGAHECQ